MENKCTIKYIAYFEESMSIFQFDSMIVYESLLLL